MFITLEGTEGAGKSTLVPGLRSYFESAGYTVLCTREPGAGEIGAAIRQILLEQGDVDPRSELLLFLADRAQHVASIIQPALDAGKTVICDRFTDSTMVYQGYARGFDLDYLRGLNTFATGGLKPDVTLLLDLPVEVGVARLTSKDRMDRQPIEFHQKVRQGFLAESAIDPARWVVLDATKQPDEILAAAVAALASRV